MVSSTFVPSDEQISIMQSELMRIWLISAHKALEDEIGEDEAVKAVRPYLAHSGVAAGLNLKGVMPADFKGAHSVAFVGAFCNYTMGITEKVTATDYGSEFNITDCFFCPCSRTFCRVHASALDELSKVSGAPTEGIVNKFPEAGRSCQVQFKSKHQVASSLSKPTILTEIQEFDLPKDQKHSLSMQYMGEWWVNAVRAFDDVMEGELATEVLKKNAFRTAKDNFMSIMGKAGLDPRGTVEIGEIILRSGLVPPDGLRVLASNDNQFRVEISECAFAASTHLICAQIEAFNDGACKSLDPNLDFEYEKMMTRGDDKCIWSIRRRKEVQTDIPRDPLLVLKHRLAKGEITIKEYDEIRRRLVD